MQNQPEQRPQRILSLLLATLGLPVWGPTLVAAAPGDCPLHAQHQGNEHYAASELTPPPSARVHAPQGQASVTTGTSASPYAGQEVRSIAGLSEERVAALRAGTGHGMALPAELHHYPGPRHLLDLRTEVGLDETQVGALGAIFDRMHERAVALGARIIEGEQSLDEMFETGTATAVGLTRLTQQIAQLEGELRATHLVAHIEAKRLLAHDQVNRYDSARGYGHASH